MQFHRFSARVAAALLSFSGLFTSCANLNQAVNGPVEAVVVVPAAQPGAFDQQLVEASANRHCEAAVRALGEKQWPFAVTAYKQALLDAPEDPEVNFGMGVAHEMNGDASTALKFYEKALKFAKKSQARTAEYQLAIERVRAKIGA
jgi:Flp pilus assembly protein TadD